MIENFRIKKLRITSHSQLQITFTSLTLASLWLGLFTTLIAETPPAKSSIDFARDIQPILSNHCWNCHGPDEKGRQANLRLDLRDSAIAAKAITPGHLDSSLLVERINSSDSEQVMPPPEFKKPLSNTQKELLKKWIAEGAPYASHWSFAAPARPPVPTPPNSAGKQNPIDHFVRNRLAQEGIPFSSEADRGTLLRRLTLDLTGLPPTPEELANFLNDPSPDAYEKNVDRLLSSQAYAERMAAQWLDLARYADTNGYNNDEDRTMWPWRDWVINAFDSNMPYDRFLIEQLAGDLLPDPKRSQLIATGFLRNQGHNTEGGIIQEEYRVEYVADRVHTTATVFLGLSMQCARCHDHKYDPISQKEYFQFFSLFNNLNEKQASYSKFVAAEPFIQVPSAQQEEALNTIQKEIDSLKQRISDKESKTEATLQQWLAAHDDSQIAEQFGHQPRHHFPLEEPAPNTDLSAPIPNFDQLHSENQANLVGKIGWSAGHKNKSIQFDGSSHAILGNVADFDGTKPFSISVWIYPAQTNGMAILSKMDEGDSYRGYDLLLENGKITSHIIHHWPDNALKVSSQNTVAKDTWSHVALTYDGSQKATGIKIYINGQPSGLDILNNNLRNTTSTNKPFHLGLREKSLPFHGQIDELMIFQGQLQPENLIELFRDQPLSNIVDWIKKPFTEQSPERQAYLKKIVLEKIDTEYPSIQKQLTDKQQEHTTISQQIPNVMVMKEMQPPRETFILNRGQYDQPTEKVSPNVPAVLRTFTTMSPANRLQLAQWLVHPMHPLTARVAVNRFWENYFGTGLVKTTEDFGVTGEFPSHPDLLDYLATTFIDSGWDVKALQKLIVMSATYKQDSKITTDSFSRDPENRLLSRGPRFRLTAETIRDNALAISGLLKKTIGGPSVKPYQPAGLWEDVTVERRGKYVPDQGDGLFRRSMYTFWKRTCPPPSMVTFDAPNREVCVARRSRTNTPLQSLVLLNDPTYIEAARALALLMIAAGGDDEQRIHAGFRRCVARDAHADELPLIIELLKESRDRFQTTPALATELNKVGTIPATPNLDPAEVAAWTIVASTLLNMDETISKR
jgi:hypothetical protein